MAAGDVLGDGSKQIALMRSQELLQRTYGYKRTALLPVSTNGLNATRWQLEADVRIATTSGVQAYRLGEIVTHEFVVSSLRRVKAPLRPVD